MSKTSYMPPAKSDVHITPDKVYDVIKEKWGFTKEEMFDPCPLDADFNGLKIRWDRVNYVNPPYTLLSEFVDRAIFETNRDNTTIMLLPSKTDQGWFHKLIREDYSMIWFKGRLKFKGEKWSATQPHFLCLIK